MKTKQKAAKPSPGGIVRITYEKLVRDGVPDHIRSEGDKFKVRKIRGKALVHLAKITEEKNEIAKAWLSKCGKKRRKKLAEELGDLLENLHGLADRLGIPWKEVKNARVLKLHKLGGFGKGYFLEWAERPKTPKQ